MKALSALSVLLGMVRLIGVIPHEALWRFGRGAGHLFGSLNGRDQRRCREHLAKAFPEWSEAEVRRRATAAFGHIGGMALWTVGTLFHDPRRLAKRMAVEGRDNLRELWKATRSGAGTLIYTGHFGNWELLSRLGGFYLPTTAVGRRLRSPLADAFIKALRTSTRTQQVDQQQGMRPCLRALQDGRMLATLADQDVPALPGVFVPWFGHLAYTPSGPAALAIRAGADCQPLFCYRSGRRWVIHIGPRRAFRPGAERKSEAQAITAWATAYQEQLLRRTPSQWVWWHKRWRTRPEDRKK
jgi:KDO2-lipid IV(A) lauroyltransferase